MENKGLYINELPQAGEVTFLAVVIGKEVRPKRNGGTFLAVRFADRSGELDGKVWDNPEAVAQLFDCDDVVKARHHRPLQRQAATHCEPDPPL